MVCERCGKREAELQITVESGDSQSTKSVCRTCYLELRQESNRFEPFSFKGESPFYDYANNPNNEDMSHGRQNPEERLNILDYFTNRAKEVVAGAARKAQSKQMGVIDTEHLLYVIVQEKEVAGRVLLGLGIKADDLLGYLDNAMIEGSVSKKQDISPRVKRVLELAFDEARSLGHSYVGPEHLFLGLIREGEGLAAQTLQKFGVDLTSARAAVVKLVGQEKIQTGSQPSNTPVLDQFSRDLTADARAGKLDPVIGRKNEIERMINILSRRTKNNPVLLGDPGVGKTAIVEGLAQRIVAGEVPEILEGKRVIALDLSGMLAGTKHRGEFEERLKKAVDEITKAAKEIILFIDELHTLVGAGSAEGAIDAANMLKPSLARGDLQAIGATTLSEYRQYIEKDAALERRFQPIIVPESSVEETIEILKGLRDRYEAHHRVRITDEAIVAAGELSDRYIQDRFLPDKAIDLIDEACAEVRLYAVAPPQNLEQVTEQYRKTKQELEAATRSADKKIVQKLEKEVASLNQTKNELTELWKRSRGTETPSVVFENVAAIVSKITGIPVAKLTEAEREKLLKLEERLHQRIVGQDEAVSAVAQALRRARAGIKDPKRPIGSFLFLGPTGVGKTELAKALAELLYGDEDAMIRLDMSEYMERHTASRLVGSPPGYVGYEEGGQLTEAVRRKPFSILLLDEIEKAHTDIYNLLLQILEDGRLTDAKGRTVDFKNTIIIATSNIGSDIIVESTEQKLSYDEMKKQVIKLLSSRFKPEFINRLDEIVVFHALSEKQILDIVELLLERTRRLLRASHIGVEFTSAVHKKIGIEGYDPVYGARPLKRMIQAEIENPISENIIAGKFQPNDVIRVDVKAANFVFEKVSTKSKKLTSLRPKSDKAK